MKFTTLLLCGIISFSFSEEIFTYKLFKQHQFVGMTYWFYNQTPAGINLENDIELETYHYTPGFQLTKMTKLFFYQTKRFDLAFYHAGSNWIFGVNQQAIHYVPSIMGITQLPLLPVQRNMIPITGTKYFNFNQRALFPLSIVKTATSFNNETSQFTVTAQHLNTMNYVFNTANILIKMDVDDLSFQLENRQPFESLKSLSPGIHNYTAAQGNFSVMIPQKKAVHLILSLHGSGETGQGYITNWSSIMDRDFVVVCPSSTNSSSWSMNEINRLLFLAEKVKRDLGLKDIFLSGASAGAHFGLVLGLNHPGVFKAMQTFMGLVGPSNKEAIQWEMLQKNKRIPVYMIQGKKDHLIPYSTADKTVDFLKSQGFKVTYDLVNDMGHEHYQKYNERIISWFLKQN